MKHINIRARTPEGAILRLLEICEPEDIATAVDLFIARLDAAEGDPDFEANGDELDGSFAEDDFCSHNLAYPGPGCPVSDGGCPTGSGAGDPAWAEWHTRGRHKVGQFGEEQCRRQDGNMACEDDEDDDPRERNGDEYDTGDAEDDELSRAAENAAKYWHGDKAGCAFADGEEPSLSVPENASGRWAPGDLGSSSDEEPWHVPVTLNAPMAANDQVPA